MLTRFFMETYIVRFVTAKIQEVVIWLNDKEADHE